MNLNPFLIFGDMASMTDNPAMLEKLRNLASGKGVASLTVQKHPNAADFSLDFSFCMESTEISEPIVISPTSEEGQILSSSGVRAALA